MINLMLYSTDASYDITQLASTVNWSGDYQSCARRLDIELLANGTDGFVPDIPCELGSRIVFQNDGQVVFDGFIFSREKSTASSRMKLTCFDRGFYLKRISASYRFSGQTPESISAQVCREYEIQTGTLAYTGIPVSRIFSGSTLYQIIMTAYTLAAEQTGKSYAAIFRGSLLCVEEKVKNDQTILLTGGGGLMSASCTESVENMVNRVSVVDSSGALLYSVEDRENILKYGLMQEILRRAKTGTDMTLQVKKTLSERGYSQKMTVENLGDMRCITGGTVAVQEPYTGINGLFWIDADTHTWKNGLYFNRLTLNFNRLMDSQEAGSLPVSAASGEAGGKRISPLTYAPGNGAAGLDSRQQPTLSGVFD